MLTSRESFLSLKHCVNNELHGNFNRKFRLILQKFESLSRSSNYKKIQKVNIINVPENSHDCILNLLNKVSDMNKDVILQKIELKITSNTNLILFVDQILNYVGKSTTNLESMWYILKNICVNTNTNTLRIINDRINDFIQQFIAIFDLSVSADTNSEEYMTFVERNHSNSSIISKMLFIKIILTDDINSHRFVIHTSLNVLFNIFINMLAKLINSETSTLNENSIFMLLECILLFINNESIRKNPFAYKKFNNTFNNEETKKKLKYKIRFKLLDILDIINKP